MVPSGKLKNKNKRLYILSIENEISDILLKNSRDFLTITQIKNSLKKQTLENLKLTKSSSNSIIKQKLEPLLNQELNQKLKLFKGSRYTYI